MDRPRYDSHGKPDPFAPPMAAEPGPGPVPEEVMPPVSHGPCPRILLPGYGLDQLQLTGTLRVPGQRRVLAFLKDPTGKAHMVREGQCLGKEAARLKEIQPQEAGMGTNGDAGF